MSTYVCPLCGSRNIEIEIDLSIFPTVAYYYCNTCHRSFTNPIPLTAGESLKSFSSENPPKIAQYGWVCPKCGIGVNPKEKTCPKCETANDNTITTGITTGTISSNNETKI